MCKNGNTKEQSTKPQNALLVHVVVKKKRKTQKKSKKKKKKSFSDEKKRPVGMSRGCFFLYFCIFGLDCLTKNMDSLLVEEKSIRVVFLDADGVLVSNRGLIFDYEDDDPTLFFDSKERFAPIERRALQNLQRLVLQTDAHIVLSTTWRIDFKMRDFLLKGLAEFGLAERLIGDTPTLSAGRGEEIRDWIENGKHNVVGYVVLDDGHSESIGRALSLNNFVQTLLSSRPNELHHEEECLTSQLTEKAIEIIQKPFHKSQFPEQ